MRFDMQKYENTAARECGLLGNMRIASVNLDYRRPREYNLVFSAESSHMCAFKRMFFQNLDRKMEQDTERQNFRFYLW